MNTLATAYSINGRPKAAKIKYINSGYLKRFRHFIENSDWDERVLNYEKGANRVCAWLIIASTLYFIPIVISAVLR